MRVVTIVAKIFTAVTREVVATSAVEVVMKDLKQVSTGLTRMFTMLVGKTTPDRATMLHIEFPISPTWHANCQG
jgi:hypothetical protein